MLVPVPKPLLHVTVPAQFEAVSVLLCPLVIVLGLADKVGDEGIVLIVAVAVALLLVQPPTVQST